MATQTLEPGSVVSRVKAIQVFFGMTPAQAVHEIKELKTADPQGFDWLAG